MKNSKKIEFFIKIAKLLQANGYPTHKLEDLIEDLCAFLEIEAEVFSSSGSIFISFKEEEQYYSRLIKVKNSDLNLHNIDSLEAIIYEVKRQKITIEEAIAKTNEIEKQSFSYKNWINTLFFAISTGSAAVVFGGGLMEFICSFLIGVFIGALFTLSAYFKRISKITVVIAAIFALIISSIFSKVFVDFKQEIATICGLIILIPGFSFTISITEIVNNHFVAGLSRLTSSFITFVMIAIGLYIGSEISKQFVFSIEKISFTFNPFWLKWISLVLVPMGFLVLFKAKIKDFIWIAIACWSSYFLFMFFTKYLNQAFSVFLSAFLLGLLSNIFAVWKQRNSSLMLVPGMILLVPGSLGFFSVSHLLQSNILLGIETSITMLSISMALVFGIIFSNIVVNVEQIKIKK
jgi:uncharacterized membrane protein YjjP (DUF1212 family)